MRIVVIGAPALAAQLAEYLHLDHLRTPEEIRADGFVLDGFPRDVAQARELDAILRVRAADVDVVLWLRGPTTVQLDNVLAHYRGRVAELDAEDLDESLDALRESLLV